MNKPQLILLAVLLSFITSIATGITTVTLMQQAPASFTVPVNRVIQQTVEKIQQVEGKTTVQTVVVKEEDLVVDALEKNKSAVFSITRNGQDLEGNSIEVSAGRGFAVSRDGIIAADALLVPSDRVYYATGGGGKFKADFLSVDEAGGFSFLKIGEAVSGTDKFILTVPTSGDLGKMKTGQKILVLGSKISSFIFQGAENMDTEILKSNAGALVLDLDGNALGMALSNETKNFVSIKTISDALPAAPQGQ